MAEETKVFYVPLRGATLDARSTKANSGELPALTALDNFYQSSSTLLPVLRGGVKYRCSIGSPTLASTTQDWLNTIVAQPNLNTQTYITRLIPTSWEDTAADLENSIRCSRMEYSLTVTEGETSVTRVSGPSFDTLVPGDFIKFDGDSTYYDIVSIQGPDSLTVAAAVAGTHTAEACLIYRTHCPYRGQWPVLYDKYGDVHIYQAVDPTGGSPIEFLRGPSMRKADSELDTITTSTTTVEGVPSTVQYYSINSLGASYIPSLWWVVKSTKTSELFAAWNDNNSNAITVWKSADGGIRWSSAIAGWYGGGSTRNKISFDLANSRVLLSNYGGGGTATNGHMYGIGGYAVDVESIGSYPLFVLDVDPFLSTGITDGTNYCFFGKERISLALKSVCYYVAIAGLVSNANGYYRDTNYMTKGGEMGGSGILDALHDGAQFVAVGEAGTIQTSPDLATWTERNGGATYKLFSVANNSTSGYVAVGSYGTVLSSADSATWTSRTSGTTEDLNQVVYADSLWVAVGKNGTILTSADMATWTAQTSGTTANLASVAWDGEHFVAVSSNTHIVLISADGATWVDTVGSAPGPVADLISNGTDDFPIGVTESAGVGAYNTGLSPYYSFTYGEWPDLATQSSAAGVAYGNSFFVAVGAGGVIATSTNGVSWETQTSGTAADLWGVCWDATNSKWIAVGEGVILSSADAITWSDDSAAIPATLTTPIFYRVRYISETTTVVAVGEDTTLSLPVTISSTDASAWTQALCRNGSTDVFRDVAYNATGSAYIWVGSSTTGCFWWSETLDATVFHWGNQALFNDLVLSGLSLTNSDHGMVYCSWTHPVDPDTDGTFEVFSDSARTALVASGTGPLDSEIVLVEEGASGLSGTVNVAADVTESFEVEPSLQYSGADLTAITGETNSLRGVACNDDYIIVCGDSLAGVMRSDYTDPTSLGSTLGLLTQKYSSVQHLSDDSFWMGSTQGFVRIIAGIQKSTTITNTEYVYWAGLGFRCNFFMILNGSVLEFGTRESSGGVWTYYPRRIRWTSPGTYSDFFGFGSGTQDFPGFGAFLTGASLENLGVIFEAGGIGVVNSTGNSDPEWGPIWEYRQIKPGLVTVSNLVKQDGKLFFVGNTGLLYATNGIEVKELGSQFDLSKFTEFPPTTPVQMVFSPATRQLLILQQTSGEDSQEGSVDTTIHCVNIDSGAHSQLKFISPGQRLSLVQIVGTGDPAWP